MKKILVLMIVLAMIPTASLAVSWNDIMTGILNDNEYTYDGGKATVSGNTVLVQGGSIKDVSISWNDNNYYARFKAFRFENVTITGGTCSVLSWLEGKSVSFDRNTSIDTDIWFEAMSSGGLTVNSEASLCNDTIFIFASENSEVTFTNGGNMVFGKCSIVASGSSRMTVNQNGTFTANGKSQHIGFSVSGDSQMIASNTGTINGDYSGLTTENGILTMKNSGQINGDLEGTAQDDGILTMKNSGQVNGDLEGIAQDDGILTMENSGHVSGNYSFNAKGNGNNMTFGHTGSVDGNVKIALLGTHTLQYSNTGSAKGELSLRIWGDSSLKGTHNPTADTPEACSIRLYPYYTITTAEKALEKAETIVLNLKKLGIISGETCSLNTYYRYKDSGEINNIVDYKNCGWIEYKYILGDNNLTFTGTDALTFGIDAPYPLLLGVYLDDVLLSSGDYSAWEGSTYIKLNPSYLSTLSVGKHKLSVVYPLGSAVTTFTIDGEVSLPQTGDTSSIVFWGALAMVSLMAIALISHKKRTNN